MSAGGLVGLDNQIGADGAEVIRFQAVFQAVLKMVRSVQVDWLHMSVPVIAGKTLYDDWLSTKYKRLCRHQVRAGGWVSFVHPAPAHGGKPEKCSRSLNVWVSLYVMLNPHRTQGFGCAGWCPQCGWSKPCIP